MEIYDSWGSFFFANEKETDAVVLLSVLNVDGKFGFAAAICSSNHEETANKDDAVEFRRKLISS